MRIFLFSGNLAVKARISHRHRTLSLDPVLDISDHKQRPNDSYPPYTPSTSFGTLGTTYLVLGLRQYWTELERNGEGAKASHRNELAEVTHPRFESTSQGRGQITYLPRDARCRSSEAGRQKYEVQRKFSRCSGSELSIKQMLHFFVELMRDSRTISSPHMFLVENSVFAQEVERTTRATFKRFTNGFLCDA